MRVAWEEVQPPEPVTPRRVRKSAESHEDCATRSVPRSARKGRFLAFVAKKRQTSFGRKVSDQAQPSSRVESTPQRARGTLSQLIMNRRPPTPLKRHVKKTTLVSCAEPPRRVKGKQRPGQRAQQANAAKPAVDKPKAKAKAAEVQLATDVVGECAPASLCHDQHRGSDAL